MAKRNHGKTASGKPITEELVREFRGKAEAGFERARRLYKEWPFFRALVDNAQLALVRAGPERRVGIVEHGQRPVHARSRP